MAEKDIKNLTLGELQRQMAEINEPPYRAKQVFFWLYRKGICAFDEMGNMPKELRDKLAKHYYISRLELIEHLQSADHTEKFLFGLNDGNFIESVLIYAMARETLCLSSQVGCKFACAFCASGHNGFVRNLFVSEIINQALFLQHERAHKITNYVFMGMGEPLDNYENVSKAILIMNDAKGMAIGARRITVSTCGIIPAIEKLKDLKLQINLSVSLHAADNKLRDELMPINKQYPLEKLIKACKDYINKAGRMITLEYILINGVNDSIEDAGKLAAIAKELKAKVNLVPFSKNFNINFKPGRKNNADIFMKRLIKNGIGATLRDSKGSDIRAACGQLAPLFRSDKDYLPKGRGKPAE